MIQRIQSLWLFLSAAVLTGFYFLSYYYANVNTIPTAITIGNDLVALILTTVSILLSLVTLFCFKNRHLQTRLTLLNIFIIAGLLLYLIWYKIGSVYNADPNATYHFGIACPILAFIFQFPALVGIRKDEKTVRSLDRLR